MGWKVPMMRNVDRAMKSPLKYSSIGAKLQQKGGIRNKKRILFVVSPKSLYLCNAINDQE